MQWRVLIFPSKSSKMVAFVYFSYNIFSYTVDALDFVWRGVSEDSNYQDCDFEDLDTEHFPLTEKCPSPNPNKLPLPYNSN